MNKNKETRLVYSSDGSHLKLCQKCHEDPCLCKGEIIPIIPIEPSKIKIKMRLEKNKRGGKLVTVLFGLPHNPPYFEELTKKLKNQLGAGGTLTKGQEIEIQGDHREKIKLHLQKWGFRIS